jgi:iron complex outermembrane recepter protein
MTGMQDRMRGLARGASRNAFVRPPVGVVTPVRLPPGAAAVRAGVMAMLLLLLPAGAWGQTGLIGGVVRDVEGRGVGQAEVVLLPGGRRTNTDGTGRFELRQVAAGAYRVEVSLIGYAPAGAAVRVTGGGSVAVELLLAASPLTLPGLQATASTSERAPAAVTQATTQLSGRALEREMGSTIAHTLQRQPGLAVRFNGPGAAMPVVRGLTGDRVLVLQDGQRAGDLAGSADDHGVTVDPLAAQRVEVVRGPATLLYGNNALGGVINIISGDVSGGMPHRAQLAVAAQSESAYPGAALSARASAPVAGVWSVTARGGVRRAGDMRIARDAVLGSRLRNSALRSQNGSIAVSRAAGSAAGSVAIRAFGFEYGVPVPPDADPISLRGGRLEAASRMELALPHFLAGTFPTLRVDATAQRYEHDELDDEKAVEQRFELRTSALNVLVSQAPAWRLRNGAWGVSLLDRRYTATGPAALTPAAGAHAWGAFGFQELVLPLGDATLQVGARADRYDIASRDSDKFGAAVERRFDALSGSAGVRLPVHEHASISLTLSRSFRAPTVEELFSAAAHAGTGSVEFGDAALRAERGRSVEGVLHVRTGGVNAQAAAYVNRIDDYITLAFQRDTLIGGAVLPVFRYVQAAAQLTGAEGSVELVLHRHTALMLRGDWLRARQLDGMPLSFMPPPRAGVTLRWDDGRYSLGGDAHHERAQWRTGAAQETPTHAHTLLRLDGGYRLTAFGAAHSLTVRIDNVTNVLHREATSRIRDFAPAPGRNIALGYRGCF